MRFEKLALRRFGHFTDFTIDFGIREAGQPDLHVLYGPNEAGKSTTLAAITDLFYGFTRDTHKKWCFLHTFDLLELEAVIQQDSKRVGVKRFKNHWSNLTNDRLDRFPLDLQGLSREEFSRRFSFDEQTLKEGSELILGSQGDVGQALFSASSGLANLRALLDDAMADANAFWMPKRRTNLQLIDLKKQLQEIKQQIKLIKLDATTYRKLLDRLSEAEKTRSDLRRQRTELQETLSRIERQKNAAVIAVQYKKHADARQALDSGGVIALDHTTSLVLDTGEEAHDALEKIRGLIEQGRLSQVLLKQQSDQLKELQRQLAERSPDEADLRVLEAAKRIRKLNDEFRSDYDWQQQQSESQNIKDQCDSDLSGFIARLGLPDVAALESILPGEAMLSEVSSLLEEEQTLSDRLTFAREELDRLESTPESDPVDASDASVDAADTALVADVLKRIRQEGLYREHARATQELLEASQAVLSQAERLGISSSTLSKLTVPAADWLVPRLTELATLRSEKAQLQSDIDTASNEIRDKLEACRILTMTGAVDPAILTDSRLARDEAWQVHASQLDAESPPADLQKSARRFQALLQTHDELTSSAIISSQKTAELHVLQVQLDQQRQRLTELQGEQMAALDRKLHDLSRQISERVSSFHAATDIDIEELRQRHADAVKLQEAQVMCETRALEVDSLKRRCDESCQTLLTVLASISSPGHSDTLSKLGLQDLFNHVERTLESVKEIQARQKEARTAREARLNEISKRSDACQHADYALARWQASWDVKVADTLFAPMSLTQVRDALPWIASIRPLMDRRRDAAGKIASMEKRIAIRDSAIDTLLADLQSDTLAAAAARLETATRQSEEHARIKDQITSLEATLSESKAAREQQVETIEDLKQALGMASDEDLLSRLARTEKHRQLHDRCKETLEQLSDLTGGDTDEASIEKLIADSDADVLASQLQECRDRLSEASDAYDDANRAWALADQAVREVDDGSQHARLIQQQRNVLVQIEEMARRTAEARCGQRVLQAAMAKFRQEHQSAILSEAQQAFTTLTGGNYVQLLPRDDGHGNEQLYAIDKTGKDRTVDKLSTGTRYQLYLALRAAAYADYASQRQPLPFVADDIMESFDDERSAAAFKVMGSMAEHGQVLYLTHHRHLLDIVQDVMGKDRVRIHHYQ